ncbi:MAG: Phosphate-binding protein [Frankiales bacterium]|nr:Phosphate-binding protein [Frankiales bacterium]
MTTSTLRRSSIAAVVLTIALAASACASKPSTTTAVAATGSAVGDAGGGSATELVGAGSSAQQAAMQAWKAGFQTANNGVTVAYDPVGSGGGREQFLAGGTVAFAGSDSALSADELAKSKTRCGEAGAIDIPVYLSAIAVVYKLDGVADIKLSPDTLAKIFDRKIAKWNDPAIAADNAGVTLPDTAITPVNRSDKSGTTKNFTDYLAQAAKATWSYPAADVWPVAGGEQAEGTSGVIGAVSGGNGTIGYADLSQAEGLGIASIKVGADFVKPTAAAAAAVLEQSAKADGTGPNDLAYTVNRLPTEAGAYPIVLVSYHIVCQNYADATVGKLVKDFETYVTSAEGQQAAATQAGSAPFTASFLAQVKSAVDSIKVG